MVGPIGIVELLMLLFPFGFVGFIIWLALNRRRDRQSKQAEVQKEIISKFSSSAEMQEFFKSDEGRALFRNIGQSQDRAGRSTRERAIGRLGIGIVLIVVGTGLLFLAHYSDQPQVMYSGQGPNGPGVPWVEVPPGTGLPAASLFLTGIGLVISALVALRLNAGVDSKA